MLTLPTNWNPVKKRLRRTMRKSSSYNTRKGDKKTWSHREGHRGDKESKRDDKYDEINSQD